MRRSARLLPVFLLALLALAAPAGAITAQHDPLALGTAAMRSPAALAGASWDPTAEPSARSSAIATEPVAGFGTGGAPYLVLSSGDATLAPAASQGNPTAQPPEASVANGGGTRGDAKDVAVLRLDLRVPAGTNCVSLKFRYFSEEYPEYVGSTFNDGFIAEMDPANPWTMASHKITAPDNFAFMPGGAFVSINSATMSAANGIGTVYDGGTQLLTAATPVAPGVHTLVLSVWDDGDTAYDSAAFIDDIAIFNTLPGGCTPGATAAIADATPPATTISGTPPATTGPSTTIAFGSNEPSSSFDCSVDHADWASCGSPVALTGLAEGPHTFEVKATDAAGNADATPASMTWSVDATPPDTTVTSGPTALTRSTTAAFAFHAGEAAASYECKLDTGAWTACASGQAYDALADGDHTFRVRAIDAVGNVDPTPATRTWTVDATAPITTIGAGPAALTRATAADFTLSGSETGVTFACRLDGDLVACAADGVHLTDVADGPHTLSVRATDPAGNEGPAATRTWTVDTVAPHAAVVTGPAALVRTGGASFTLSAGEAGATLECDLDSAGFAPCDTSLALADLADGEHTLRVRATDLANNEGAVAVRAWTVDTIAPSASFAAAPGALVRTASADVTLASDDGSATFECRLDGAEWTPCASPLSLHDLADGDHALHLRATDAAGNTGAAAIHTWTVDTRAPAATIDAGPAGVTGSAGAQLVFSAGEDGATFECRLDGADWAPCATPLDLTPLADGEHVLCVRATDPAGNVGAVVARTWTVDTTAPTAPAVQLDAAPTSPSSDRAPSLAFGGEGGATFECRVDAADWAPCSSPLRLVDLGDGAHAVQLRQRDGAGNWSAPATHRWVVDTAAPAAPAILAGPDGTVGTGTAKFAFAAEPGATLECRVDGGVWAPCPDALDLSDLAPGDHVLEVRQIDAAGNAGTTAERRWTVRPPAPVAAAPASAAAPVPAALVTRGPTARAPAVLSANVGTAAGTPAAGAARRATPVPVAVVRAGTLPVGCAVAGASLRRCTVDVLVGGRRVGRGTATYATPGTSSARVDVRLSGIARAQLQRSDAAVKATFVFHATTFGASPPLVTRRTAVLQPTARWILPSDGLFATDSARLAPPVRRYLRAIAPLLHGAEVIRVEGHTDSRGGRAHNRALGLRRAQAVRAQLRRLGVAARLSAVSRGESRPRATNATPLGRWRNRRVELRVLR